MTDVVEDGQPVLAETTDGLFAAGVVYEECEVCLFDLCGEVGGRGGIYDFSEDVLGVCAHVGREDYFFVNFRHFCSEVGDDSADEGSLADTLVANHHHAHHVALHGLLLKLANKYYPASITNCPKQEGHHI